MTFYVIYSYYYTISSNYYYYYYIGVHFVGLTCYLRGHFHQYRLGKLIAIICLISVETWDDLAVLEYLFSIYTGESCPTRLTSNFPLLLDMI
jgi:hypothetical protein